MKSNLKRMTLAAGFAAALGLGYLLGAGDRQHDFTNAATAAGAAMAAPAESGRKVKYWKSSMDPNYVRDAPGKDTMGMDLVPVYEGGPDEAGGISIDPVTIQNMGVRTAPVARRDLTSAIRAVGLVAYDERKRFSINSKIDGWIERLHVNQTGQFIKKGQPLMEIYSPELVAAQQEYLLALDASSRLAGSVLAAAAEGAQRLREAARTRLAYWDISDAQIRKLEKTRQVHKRLTLHSPYSGIVTMKQANEGMRVMGGGELLQVSDISSVWVNAEIYEYQLPWVRTGQQARVEIPFAPGKSLTGTIAYVYPYLQNDTRTVHARIELPNPGFELKPDMYANVVIEGRPVPGALAIPGDAVLTSGKGQTAFVALGEGRFEPRPIKTGLTDDDGYAQVLSGLREGESVVTSAQFMLDSESKLREAALKMMEVQQAAVPGHEGHAAPLSQSPPDNPAESGPHGDHSGSADNEDLFK